MRASALAALTALVVLTVAGGTARAFVPGPVVDVSAASAADNGGVVVPPEWSSDGVLVFAGRDGTGAEQLRQVNADGTGQADVVQLAAVGQTTANIAVRATTTLFVAKTAPPPFPLESILLDGTGLTQIAALADDTPAKFSPDASQVAFTQSGQLKLVAAGGGSVTSLQSPAAPVSTSLVRWATNNALYGLAVNPPAAPQLYSLAPNPASTPTYSPIVLSPGQSPAVSPDGTKVLWSNATGLHIASFDGTGVVDLDASGQQGAFSGDGTLITYTAPTGIYTIKPDGSGKTLVSTSTDCILPRFNPSATTLACFHVTTKAIAIVALPNDVSVPPEGESVHVNDSAQVFPPASAPPSDESVHVDDSAAVYPPASAGANEGVGVHDEVHVYPPADLSADEGVGINDNVQITPGYLLNQGEGVGINDSVAINESIDHFTVVASTTNPGANEQFTLTITARDALDHVAAAYSGPVSFTDLAGSLTHGAANFVNGVAAVTVSVGVPFVGEAITVHDAGDSPGASGTSPLINVVGPPTHFLVVPSASDVGTGQHFGVTITALDVFNDVVTSFPGPVTLTDSSGSLTVHSPGVWVNATATATVSVANQTFSDVITATDASGLSAATGSSVPIIVTLKVDHFLVQVGLALVNAGQPQPVTVKAVDGGGNPVPSFAGPVTLTDQTGTLTIATPLSWSGGVGTGSVRLAGAASTDHVTATDPSSGATGTNPNGFVVIGPVDHFKVVVGLGFVPSGGMQPVTITAQDALNQVVTTFAGPVVLGDTSGVLAPGAVVSWSAGVGKTSVSFTAATLSDHITATAGAATGTNPLPFVVAGILDHFKVQVGYVSASMDGPQPVTITAQDSLNQTLTTYPGPVVVTDTAGVLLSANVNWANGVGHGMLTFSGPALSDKVTATDAPTGKTGTNANAFSVYGHVHHFKVSVNLATVQIGFPLTVTMVALDSLGQVVINYAGPVTLTDTAGLLVLGAGPTWTAGTGKRTVGFSAPVAAEHVTAADPGNGATGTNPNAFQVVP